MPSPFASSQNSGNALKPAKAFNVQVDSGT